MGLVLTREELSEAIRAQRDFGKTIVTTNGCFDILHVGHVRFLKAARQLGDTLIVGVNSDESVSRLKGPTRPIQSQADRAEIIASLECVDFVTIFGEDTPVEFLKIAKPDLHAKGADYKPSDLAETPVVRENGGDIRIIELVPGKSTTAVVTKLSAK